MILEGERLRTFDITEVPLGKRPKIRKGLRSNSVERISDLESVLERMREINVAQAARQELGAGAETPVSRYTVEADDWRDQIRREFALADRDWWGAFIDGVLVAYLRTYQVQEVRVIQQTKVDPAFFKFYPMDALYYTVLSGAAADPTCQRIVNGDQRHASLNHYKEQFLFRAVEVPYYSSSAWLVEAAKKLQRALVRRSKSA